MLTLKDQTDAMSYAGKTVTFTAELPAEPVTLPVILTGDRITDGLALQMAADTFHRAVRTMRSAEGAPLSIVRISMDMDNGQNLWLGAELTGNWETDDRNMADMAWSFYQRILNQ